MHSNYQFNNIITELSKFADETSDEEQYVGFCLNCGTLWKSSTTMEYCTDCYEDVADPPPLIDGMAAVNVLKEQDVKFEAGLVILTTGIVHLIKQYEMNFLTPLARHVTGDWGDLGSFDSEMNENAIKNKNDKVLSAYNVLPACGDTIRIWIVTEDNMTVVMKPIEY